MYGCFPLNHKAGRVPPLRLCKHILSRRLPDSPSWKASPYNLKESEKIKDHQKIHRDNHKCLLIFHGLHVPLCFSCPTEMFHFKHKASNWGFILKLSLGVRDFKLQQSSLVTHRYLLCMVPYHILIILIHVYTTLIVLYLPTIPYCVFNKSNLKTD